MQSDSTGAAQPYGSAADLPSFQEMTAMIEGAKLLTLFFDRDKRSKFVEIEAQRKKVEATVDRFYELLGARHWVFSDRLNFDDVAEAVEEASSAEELEARYIEIHRARLEGDFWWSGALNRDEAIRARRPQLERAREHYLAGHYDSCTLQLITVMDGFVNDFQPEVRQGLHAREADEMMAWDSVVGHTRGLTNALKPFRKGFKKRHDDEVFEVYRNGIMHGIVTNFDNEVVATKAWNLLGAVLDWATATEKEAKAEPPTTPSLRESRESLKTTVTDMSERKKHRDEWVGRTVSASDDGFADEPVVMRSTSFLVHWQSRNFGELGTYPMHVLVENKSRGEAAKFAKDVFWDKELTDFTLDSVNYTMPSVAELSGVATVNGEGFRLDLRWIYQDGTGDFLVPTQPGEWQLLHYSPRVCLKPIDDPA